jgi:hypothetical protein
VSISPDDISMRIAVVGPHPFCRIGGSGIDPSSRTCYLYTNWTLLDGMCAEELCTDRLRAISSVWRLA